MDIRYINHLFLIVVLVLLASCGGGGSGSGTDNDSTTESSTPTPDPEPDPDPEPEPEPAPEQALELVNHWGHGACLDFTMRNDIVYCAAKGAGTEIYRIEPGKFVPIGNLDTAQTSKNSPETSDIKLVDNKLYVGSRGNWITIYDVTIPDTPTLLGEFPGSDYAGVNDIEVIGNYAYVFLTYGKIAVFDIHNPEQISEVGQVGLYNEDSTYSEMGYMAINGDVMYVTDYNNFYIIDITDLANPQIITKRIINSAGALGAAAFYLDVDRLYSVGTSGLDVYDISDAFNPIKLKTIGGTYGDAVTTHDGLLFYSSYYHPLSIYSISDDSYLGGQSVNVELGQVYTIGVIDGSLYISSTTGLWELVDYDETTIKLESVLDSQGNANKLLVYDEYIFLLNYAGPIRVLDQNLQLINAIDGQFRNMAISEKGLLYAANGPTFTNFVQAFDITDIDKIAQLSEVDLNDYLDPIGYGWAESIVVENDMVFIFASVWGADDQVLSFTDDKTLPFSDGKSVSLEFDAYAMVADDNNLYFTGSGSWIKRLDLTTWPYDIEFSEFSAYTTQVTDINFANGKMYVSSYQDIEIYGKSEINEPVFEFTYHSPNINDYSNEINGATDFLGNLIYISQNSQLCLLAAPLTEDSEATCADPVAGFTADLLVVDDHIYVTGGTDGRIYKYNYH
ncbi:LVIVD repeat-containing protein [Microbulbifer sp. JMSA004]|uniref:LVIVD repeat-containing protein n=1 Tax=unclassified Microbulbifer TaxID=2619833 RepID=UPI0024AD3F8D|nr:hypothetical protein [Microbulbifer sp. VAAF005]WHI47013.1 hypothetical protein P0078_01165 [Microbulbifer sp. VAAF005]